MTSTPFVAALCLAAALAALALVRRLGRRPGLRAKIVALVVGLVGVELAVVPALLVALFGGGLLGTQGTDIDLWIVAATYGLLTLYVIARLFPWREVEALTADPEAKLGDVLARLRGKED